MAFEESFYTVRAQRLASADLRLEYAGFYDRGQLADGRASEIEYHMARGDEQFYKRHYFEALKEYKLALGLMYQLVEPSFNPLTAIGSDIRLPVSAALFEPMTATVLSVFDRSPDSVPQIAVTPPTSVDPILSASLISVRNLGARTIDQPIAAAPDVARDISLADEHMRARQFSEAIPFYNSAIEKLGTQGPATLLASLRQNLGVAYGETQQFGDALTAFQTANQGYTQTGDVVAQAATQENIAALHIRSGQYDQAQRALSTALDLYGRAGTPAPDSAVAAGQTSFTANDLTNATIRLTQQSNALAGARQRGSFFGRLTSRIQRAIEPQPIVTPEFILRPLNAATSVAGATAAAGAANVTAGAPRLLRVVTGIRSENEQSTPAIFELNLADANRIDQVRQVIYQTRVNAASLSQLGVGVGATLLPDWFRVNIPRHYFYTVQICLGDTYVALGQFAESLQHYESARDYQFLNVAIEAPNTWIRMARCLLKWGEDLYRKNQINDALGKLQAIIEVAVTGELSVPADSPLYNRPPFAAIQPQLQAFIQTLNTENPATLNPEMAMIIRQARVYQDMIHAGLNILGLPLELIPIFRFRYLQAVARYFAEQAIKAERDYITFKSTSEQETAALLQLQQAEDLARDNVELERRRVDEAVAEQDFAAAAQTAANNRVANAAARRNDYITVSADKVALDTATAHASGGFTETEGGYQVNLATSGQTVNLGDKDYEIMRNAAWHRGMIQRQFELDDMQRTINEYQDNADVAAAQAALAAKRRSVADQNKAIADLRLTQASANRQFAEDKTFNGELWSNLADRMREISQLYLDRAIEIALMMQAAYNFESDTNLNKIGTNYSTGEELGGLLGGDALLADINFFTFHQITQTRSKEIPAKAIISLADRYPFSLFQFRRTGIADFETKLEDFDRMYPGSYMHKIKAVELVVEGLINADGWSGCLKNSGTSSFRTRDNQLKTRLQPAETLLLSTYSIKSDAVVFQPSEETLGVFEDSGAATAWTLHIPRGSNDLNYDAISDVKVVLYYRSFFDPGLEATVRAALPANGTRARSFSLRFNYPDAFFLFLERGNVGFDIRTRDFPFNQTNPTIDRIAVYVLTEDGVSPQNIEVQLSNTTAAHQATVQTGADGTASSDAANPGAPLNAFIHDSPLDSWSVLIDRAANPAVFREEPPGSGIFRIVGIRDIVVTLDYRFAFRQ
jgi:Tc toxin complex TcA C-terminal TcB-binding domain